MKHYIIHSPTTFSQIITNGAEKYGDRSAIVHQNYRISYAQLLQMSEQLARALCENGVRSGDRVALVLPDSWHFLVSAFAVTLAGAIVVPLDFAIRPANFKHIVRDCGVKVVILDHSVISRLVSVLNEQEEVEVIFAKNSPSTLQGPLNKVVHSLDRIFQNETRCTSELLPAVDPEAVVSITYTSGSTGQPKGVMHSHRSWISGAVFTGDYLKLSDKDKILIPLPLHHAYSFRHVLAYLINGGTLVLAADIFEALRILKVEKPNGFLLVPAACNMILKYFRKVMEDCSSFLDFVSIGTAAMPAQPLQDFQNLLPNTKIHLPYGLTEARVGFLCGGDDASTKRVFALPPGLEIKVVNQKGELAQRGETGEIYVKGEGVMVGYWNSRESERRMLQEKGFPTGDLGRVEENGEIALLGRLDDVIKVGGRKVDPHEIEDILNQHPSVFESAVMGVRDPKGLMDRQLKALVVLKEGRTISEDELIGYCKKYLEPYKVPTSIVFKSSLPKSSVGKVLKRVSEDDSVEV